MTTETPAADIVERELNRAIEHIMGIEIDAMRGDNLAVTLCSHFEDADDDTEPDDNGWKQSAIDAYDAIKQSIDGLFTPVRAEITRLRAENDELQRELAEAVKALALADDAIAEMFRYYDGGETRGSYDGKPERAGLRKAGYVTRAALTSIRGEA